MFSTPSTRPTLRAEAARSASSSRSSVNFERGVAMLIVITILVTMVLVAVPFALSMRQGQERTQANVARSRARYEANLLADLVKLFLVRTHPYQEQLRYDRGDRSVDANPGVDTLAEIIPDDSFRTKIEAEIIAQWERDPAKAERARYLKARGLGPMNDDRGSIWTVLVQDAQALVNVNGGNPFLLANLLGSALLTDDLDTGGGDIAVEHVVTGRFGGLRGFPRDGGYLRVGREVIRYEEFDGQTFRGCERGVLLETPLRDNGSAESHKQGTPIIDYTAYKLATNLISRRPGQLTPFENLEALRDISSWGEGGVLRADRLERLLPYLTAWSGRETAGPWLADNLVMNELPTSGDGDGPDEVQLRDFRENPSGSTSYVNPGTIVRLTDGIETVYGMVDAVGDVGGRRRGMFFTTAGRVNAGRDDLTFKGGETKASAAAPYPININTASQVVLYAVMANIQLWRASGKEQIVHPDLAWKLAEEIVRVRKGAVQSDTNSGNRASGPFRHAEDFGRWLDEKVRTNELTRAQVAALYLNAINPNSSELRFGTAPWCYRTLDTYHVEARVALNNRAGEQIAEASVREVVEIGSDTNATWTLDSQAEFEPPLAMGSGGKWITTYPFGVGTKLRPGAHHIQPAMRGPKSYVNNIYPSDTRGEDIGDVRLEPARMLLPGAQVENHFDANWYTDGWYTGYDGVYTRPVKGSLMANNDPLVRPFSMSFWWRPYSDGNWTAFDAGKEQFMNRFALFVQEGTQGQELTFRCCAGNKWRQGAEVYVPLERLDYQPGNWYHFHVSCRGEDPSTMQLLVDGVDIGKRRGFSGLTSSVLADAEEISVGSTDGFPIRGAIRVGNEIIEYQSKSETSFRDCVRGARGTLAQDWPSNAPAHNLGYSMPLLTDVYKGGRLLDETLRKWSAVRITTVGQSDVDEEPWMGGVSFRGYSGDRTEMGVKTVAIWDRDISEDQEAFGSRGIALMGCRKVQWDPGATIPAGTSSSPSGTQEWGGWEFVYYERDGSDFQITRYWKSSYFANASEHPNKPYFLITEVIGGVRVGAEQTPEIPAYLVPISVYASGGAGEAGEDYPDPSQEEELTMLTRYPDSQTSTDTSARVLIGTDTPVGAHEIIRYDSIDRKTAGTGILFVRDRGVQQWTWGFFGQWQGNSTPQQLGGNTPPTEDPPTPPDEEPPVPPTPDPTPGDPGGSDPADPTPGDGVPPGLRDPQDGPTPDAGDPTDPGSGDPGSDEPGTGDSPTPGSSGPAGDASGGEGDDPLGDGNDGFEPDGSGGTSDDEGSDARPGDSVGPGDRPAPDDGSGDTAGDPPPEEEPAPDGSGGGGDFGGGESDAEGDAKIPDVVDPGAREPADPTPVPDDPDPASYPVLDPVWSGGEQNEPYPWEQAVGLADRGRHVEFRGVNRNNPAVRDDIGGLDHQSSSGGDNENSKFLPCFRVWEQSRVMPVARIGRNDVITFSDGQKVPVRQEMGVRWGDPQSQWCALVDFLDEKIKAAEEGANVRRNDPRGHPRVLKFPCGELPDEMATELEWGQSTLSGTGLVTAFLDELFVWRQGLDTTIVVNEVDGLLETADEVRLARVGADQDLTTLDGYDRDCGLILLEGELIVYRGSRLEGETELILERCVRGVMGTKASFHGRGAEARLLPDIPVSYLASGLTADASSVGLARTTGFPREGLVRVVRDDTAELMHYTRVAEKELLMPKSLDADERTRDRGLLRGRFGTTATDHDTEEVVFFQPFRYWDRFTPRRSEDTDSFGGVHDHPETSYLELGTRARSGLWRGFTWSENLMGRLSGGTIGSEDGSTAESGLLDIYVLARFNPNVAWDTRNIVDLRSSVGFGRAPDLTGKMNSHLFLFDSIGDATIGGRMRGNRLDLESDTAEFRLYFVYKPNAFTSLDGARRGSSLGDDIVMSNIWKQTPWLRSFTVNYFSRTEVRHRAALR